jgi:hypothetical protein
MSTITIMKEGREQRGGYTQKVLWLCDFCALSRLFHWPRGN